MKTIRLFLFLVCSLASMAFADISATLKNQQLIVAGKALPPGSVMFLMKTTSGSTAYISRAQKKTFDIENRSFSITLPTSFLVPGGVLGVAVAPATGGNQFYSIDVPCDQSQWSSKFDGIKPLSLGATKVAICAQNTAPVVSGSGNSGPGVSASNDPSCNVDVSPTGDNGDRIKVSIGCKPGAGKSETKLDVRVYGGLNTNGNYIENTNFRATQDSNIVPFPRDIQRDMSHNQNIRVELVDNDTRIKLPDTDARIARVKTHNFPPKGAILSSNGQPDTNTNAPFEINPLSQSNSRNGGDLKWDVSIMVQVSDDDVNPEDNDNPIAVQLFELGANGQPGRQLGYTMNTKTDGIVQFPLEHKWSSSMFNRDPSPSKHTHEGDLHVGENWLMVRVCDAYDNDCKVNTVIYPYIKVVLPDPAQGH